MLRSAINNATLMAAARRSVAPSSAAKASLSTLSFHTSSIEDTSRSSDNRTHTPVMSASDAFRNNIKSSIFNLFANLIGDVTLVLLDQAQSRIEEEDWGDTTSSTDIFVLKEEEAETPLSLSLWLISTLKRRKKMMNKHKLRKRRKKLRLKTRK